MKQISLIFFHFLCYPLIAQETPKDSLENKVYAVVEKTAEFPGGQDKFYKFFNKNMRYPADARRKGIEGNVFVRFIIEKDGAITNTEIVKGVSEDLDMEAKRVINAMPNWSAGEKDGRKVRQMYTLPIQFKLAGRKR
jgi:periplasmic protein TonB